MGTLKDISLFGSFSFPLDGEYAGGIVARSLAGTEKELKKTKMQVQSLSGRQVPLAGQTGATIQQEVSSDVRAEPQPSNPSEDYSVQFIQHAAELAVTPDKVSAENFLTRQPSQGFGLKKNSGKRVTFTVAQKEVMIEFYDRQATQGIRANPRDCVEVMKQQGLGVLKENQIRSWWSTYHQKRKNAVSSLAEKVSSLANSRNQNIHSTNARDQTQGRVEMSSQKPTPNNASEPTRLQNTGASNQSTQLAHNDSPCPVNEQSIGRTVL